jgi:hypothetical protein
MRRPSWHASARPREKTEKGEGGSWHVPGGIKEWGKGRHGGSGGGPAVRGGEEAVVGQAREQGSARGAAVDRGWGGCWAGLGRRSTGQAQKE